MTSLDQIKQTFFQECDELLAELEAGLIALDEGRADRDVIDAVFRAVHSIKGGAGAFSLQELVEFSHRFESTLDLVRIGSLTPTPKVTNALLKGADVLADLIHAAREPIDVLPEFWQKMADELGALANSEASTPTCDGGPSFSVIPIALPQEPIGSKEARTFEVTFRPTREFYARAHDPRLIIRELQSLGCAAVRCCTSDVPTLDTFNGSKSYFSWVLTLTTTEEQSKIDEVFEFALDDCDVSITQQGPSNGVTSTCDADVTSGHDTGVLLDVSSSMATRVEARGDVTRSDGNVIGVSETIRVDLERVDRLIDLVGELVISSAMLSQKLGDTARQNPMISAGLDELDQVTREIQESVMAIRAQPVKSLFQRMSRIVREAADATGKRVKLRTDGDSTEVDKTVIERLVGPLTHMIRNAVDHGIEAPSKRAELGKAPEGTLHLSAAHRSGRVIIELSDDGAGIDRAKVRTIATAKGLVGSGDHLSESEIDNLLFAPGFSTASELSSLSGRGVGLDVVKQSVQGLGGRIAIASQPGQGTVFSLSLPLTLAILDGMIITLDARTLVVPLSAIIETLRPQAGQLHKVGLSDYVLRVREQFIPVVDVAYALGFRREQMDPTVGVAILVDSEGEGRHALLVDSIQDQRQVVIKSLETNYGPIQGIAAATILGDGRVALIIDVDGLTRTDRSTSQSVAAQASR